MDHGIRYLLVINQAEENAPLTVRALTKSAVKKIKGPALPGPGLHNQSLRIPMAFTAHSQRVRCRAVFPSRLLK